jgi:DNA-binding FadR family transcriptional regulator
MVAPPSGPVNERDPAEAVPTDVPTTALGARRETSTDRTLDGVFGLSDSSLAWRASRPIHRSDGTTQFAADMTDVGPADVMAARNVLEPNTMPYVVARATARDFELMRLCLDGGDSATNHEEFDFWGRELHRTIVYASRNALLTRLYEAIDEARHSRIWGDVKRLNASDDQRADDCRDHRAVVAALEARDSARASEAMRAHLARVNNYLFGSIG